VRDALRRLHAAGARDVVVVPIGFLSDHMEVIYDLDVEAADVAREIGLNLVRAGTVGTHPKFVRMVRDLIEERRAAGSDRPTVGALGPCPDVCPADCCPPPLRPPRTP
jgi:ferrochelatase